MKKTIHIFEDPLQNLGKTLDEYFNEIAFDPIKKTDVNEKKNNNDKIIIKNEILSIFNKSKLNPKQFANMILLNNVYIENEKPGDWTRLKTYEVDEMMNNMRHENDIDYGVKKDETINYNTTIRQKFI
jgi:hypothetical protein